MPTKLELSKKDKRTVEQLITYLGCSEQVPNFKRKRGFVFNFALIWNLFEDTCMNNFAKISEVNSFVDRLVIPNNSTIADEIYLYMRNRYIVANTGTFNFIYLLWRNSNTEQQIKNTTKVILENPQSTIKEKIKAVLYVIFRLRNNLFHGEKDIVTINAQQETFVLVNKFLLDLIELSTPRRV